MKRFATLILASICALGVLAGCSNKSGSSSEAAGTAMKEGYTVESVVNQVADEVGVTKQAEVDEESLKVLFYQNMDDVESYYGAFTMVNISADNIVGIQAKPGKIDAVKEGLEKRKEDMRKSFEGYLPDQLAKVEKGQIVVKGDYAFLLILGESEDTFDSDMEKALKVIDSAF